ncbi:VOC family protein [Streptomyces pinistramenti]|uniref:VOC family protein n=1 Tax=Streptomyces pinistramenti TaxID=2884812 RepID=UPI001D081002|nr:VOC family protein [Streptomyces pinistramenti]MCB5911395.1 VOC family protein [Streptomyces pinistramenti]
MQFQKLGVAVLSDDVAASGRFYTEHFGFTPVAALDWYVSLHHDAHPSYVIDLVQRGHDAMPEGFRTQDTAGLCLGFLVADAAAEEAALRAAGVEIAEPLRDEPWGQRRFNVWSPEGILIEVLQTIDPDPEWLAAQGL